MDEEMIYILLDRLISTVIIYCFPIAILRFVILRRFISREAAKAITIAYGVAIWILYRVFEFMSGLQPSPNNVLPALIWSSVNYLMLYGKGTPTDRTFDEVNKIINNIFDTYYKENKRNKLSKYQKLIFSSILAYQKEHKDMYDTYDKNRDHRKIAYILLYKNTHDIIVSGKYTDFSERSVGKDICIFFHFIAKEVNKNKYFDSNIISKHVANIKGYISKSMSK